jgi:hypothetical protein
MINNVQFNGLNFICVYFAVQIRDFSRGVVRPTRYVAPKVKEGLMCKGSVAVKKQFVHSASLQISSDIPCL